MSKIAYFIKGDLSLLWKMPRELILRYLGDFLLYMFVILCSLVVMNKTQLTVSIFLSSVLLSLIIVARVIFISHYFDNFTLKNKTERINWHKTFDLIPVPIFAIYDDQLSYCNLYFSQKFSINLPLSNHDHINVTKLLNLDSNDFNQANFKNLIANYKFLDKNWIIIPLANIEHHTYHLLLEMNKSEFALSSLKKYLELSNVPQVILNNTGLVEFANPAFYQLVNQYGYYDHRWHFSEIIANADDKAKIIRLIDQANLIGQSSRELKIKSEETLIVSINLRKIFLEDNEQELFLTTLNNITDHKNLEMHFAHAQKMQTIGHLAGGIAHDFNNLLTAMLGFCDLLLLRHQPEDQSFSDIMQIKQNTNRAINLVRQLLSFSRKQSFQLLSINVNDSLTELSNLITRLIGENIELRLEKIGNLPQVKFDKTHFDQILINLAVNARDAMNKGGVLTIKTYHKSLNTINELGSNLYNPPGNVKFLPGDYVIIEVIDDGCGIEPKMFKKIFEPFFTTKANNDGTGLGLSTVIHLIRQVKGLILMSSEINIGTRFLICLKAEVETNTLLINKTEENLNNVLEYNTTDLSGNATVLVVEDEIPVRIFSSHALKSKGFEVLEADCAESALKILDQHNGKIDLIISDVIMPGMNGPDFICIVRKKYPHIKVVFISGYAEDAFAKNSSPLAKDYQFLPKPFTLKQLLTKVKELVH